MAQHGHLTREEKKKIRVERKKLRKDLRKKGIRKRQEFEEIAQMLGLVYGDDYPAFLWLWWKFWKWFTSLGALAYLLATLAIFGMIFPLAYMANQKGGLMISETEMAIEEGLVLKENKDSDEIATTLHTERLKIVNAYTVSEIPEDINDTDGSHNLDDVIAYTFYLENDSERDLDFNWYLIMSNATLNVDDATWLMVFDEDGMILYAKANEDGSVEHATGCFEPNFMDVATERSDQFISEGEGFYTIVPKAWLSDNLVTQKTGLSIKAGEAKKYTVVIWAEGFDDDCTEAVLGGHAGFRMIFTAGDNDTDKVEKYLKLEN